MSFMPLIGRIVLGIAMLAVVGYVLAAAYLYFFQEKFVYKRVPA